MLMKKKAPSRPPRGEENAIRMASLPLGELVGAFVLF